MKEKFDVTLTAWEQAIVHRDVNVRKMAWQRGLPTLTEHCLQQVLYKASTKIMHAQKCGDSQVVGDGMKIYMEYYCSSKHRFIRLIIYYWYVIIPYTIIFLCKDQLWVFVRTIAKKNLRK